MFRHPSHGGRVKESGAIFDLTKDFLLAFLKIESEVILCLGFRDRELFKGEVTEASVIDLDLLEVELDLKERGELIEFTIWIEFFYEFLERNILMREPAFDGFLNTLKVFEKGKFWCD